MKKIIALIAVSVLLMAASAALAQGAVPGAEATLKDSSGKDIGFARFTEDNNGLVHIEARVKGLTPGKHGIHIHEKGSCSPTFAAAGDHYNPGHKHHGLDNPAGAHAGDLPQLDVDRSGNGYLSATTDRVTLSPGPDTLFTKNGTSLVVHAKPDDQMTDPSGNSGDRIACGVIVKK
jgi:superoxide dismutase, Cu-Zn family